MEKRRKSTRLLEYDYSQNGYYFVTICCTGKRCLFGKVRNEEMTRNHLGDEAKKCWEQIPEHYPDVELGEYIVMPNHIHGIIIIKRQENVGAQNFEPKQKLQNKFQQTLPKSLGSIIRGFKIGVTKYAKENGFTESPWQRNYHEHVIRSEEALEKISDYIKYNPILWEKDKYFEKGSKY